VCQFFLQGTLHILTFLVLPCVVLLGALGVLHGAIGSNMVGRASYLLSLVTLLPFFKVFSKLLPWFLFWMSSKMACYAFTFVTTITTLRPNCVPLQVKHVEEHSLYIHLQPHAFHTFFEDCKVDGLSWCPSIESKWMILFSSSMYKDQWFQAK